MRPEYSHRPIDFRYLSSAMRWLLGANIAGFLLIHFVPQFYDLFSLVPAHFWKDRYIWQVVTYMFLHGGLLHLIFNLLALWMFGMPVESQWGSWEFLKYFFLCGIGAGLVSVAMQPHSVTHIIGASGAIFGLLVAYAMMYPDAVVYLYGFFPIKASHMAILFGFIEFLAGITSSTPGIAWFTHLSGMLIGYVYLRWWWEFEIRIKGQWRAWVGPRASGSMRSSSRIPATPKRAPAKDADADLEAEVDRILDKISAHGKESLSREELEILKRESERKKSKWGHA